jgi:hypothetical protein
MQGIFWLVILAAAILQIAMIVTFFSMNTKLGNIERYLFLMARKEGLLPKGKDAQSSSSQNQFNWRCPSCQVMNGPSFNKCAKCGTARPD